MIITSRLESMPPRRKPVGTSDLNCFINDLLIDLKSQVYHLNKTILRHFPKGKYF